MYSSPVPAVSHAVDLGYEQYEMPLSAASPSFETLHEPHEPGVYRPDQLTASRPLSGMSRGSGQGWRDPAIFGDGSSATDSVAGSVHEERMAAMGQEAPRTPRRPEPCDT